MVTLAVKALWRKSGRAVSDDEGLYAIAVLADRAESAATVIHDPVKYFPAAIRREADVFAELLPKRAATESPPAQAPATAAGSPWEPHAYVETTRHNKCLECEMPRGNQKAHPPHLQARSA